MGKGKKKARRSGRGRKGGKVNSKKREETEEGAGERVPSPQQTPKEKEKKSVMGKREEAKKKRQRKQRKQRNKENKETKESKEQRNKKNKKENPRSKRFRRFL